MNHPDVTGIVLAGGKSSRMGTNKALLLLNGKPLIQHAVDLLRQVCGHVVISAHTEDYAFTGCETWPDIITTQAPMIGIYSCLKRSTNTINIVLTCDMPLVTTELFDELLTHAGHHDIVLPVHDEGYIEPLCGVYNKRVISGLDEQIRLEQFGMQNFIKKSGFCALEISPGLNFYPTNMFVNVNTMNDFDLLYKS